MIHFNLLHLPAIIQTVRDSYGPALADSLQEYQVTFIIENGPDVKITVPPPSALQVTKKANKTAMEAAKDEAMKQKALHEEEESKKVAALADARTAFITQITALLTTGESILRDNDVLYIGSSEGGEMEVVFNGLRGCLSDKSANIMNDADCCIERVRAETCLNNILVLCAAFQFVTAFIQERNASRETPLVVRNAFATNPASVKTKKGGGKRKRKDVVTSTGDASLTGNDAKTPGSTMIVMNSAERKSRLQNCNRRIGTIAVSLTDVVLDLNQIRDSRGLDTKGIRRTRVEAVKKAKMKLDVEESGVNLDTLNIGIVEKCKELEELLARRKCLIDSSDDPPATSSSAFAFVSNPKVSEIRYIVSGLFATDPFYEPLKSIIKAAYHENKERAAPKPKSNYTVPTTILSSDSTSTATTVVHTARTLVHPAEGAGVNDDDDDEDSDFDEKDFDDEDDDDEEEDDEVLGDVAEADMNGAAAGAAVMEDWVYCDQCEDCVRMAETTLTELPQENEQWLCSKCDEDDGGKHAQTAAINVARPRRKRSKTTN